MRTFLFVLLMCTGLSATFAQPWSELGTGPNAINANDEIMSMITDASGNIYAAGFFTDNSGHRYVAKWDGSSWTELGALNANDNINTLAIDAAGNVYATGYFTDASGYPYVAKWDGSSWTELGALNASNYWGRQTYIQGLATDAAGNVYAAGDFTDNLGNDYVAKWDGNSWTNLGALNVNSDIYTLATDAAGNVYAAGRFTDNSYNYYVAKWDGNSWTELGALNANGDINTLAIDATGNVYAAGDFTDQSYSSNVAKWDGTSWTFFAPLYASDNIQTLAIDAPGNVYVGGWFTNAAGNEYVAKWDGTMWSELGGAGSLIGTNAIRSIIVDKTGTVNVAGHFDINSNTNATVVKYVPSAVDSIQVGTVANLPAIISAIGRSLSMEATIYPASASQSATWSIVPGTGTATISATGVVTAQSIGTVWAKAVSAADITKMDSMLVTIDNSQTPIDSVVVSTQNNVAATILTKNGSLQLEVQVYPAIASQTVTWSMIAGTGAATISGTGLVTAQSDGTVWAKAVSTANPAKMDSIQITISNQVAPIDSVVVRTQNNVAATITTKTGSLQLEAQVYPATASQTVTWSMVPGTGAASISGTGLVTAQSDGTVWAKAVSTSNPAKMDSIQILINQKLGVNEVEQAIGFNVYPNPVNTQLNIETSLQSKPATISVYSIIGTRLRTIDMKDGKASVDVSQLAAGVYLLKYADGTNNIQTRFVKQ